MLVNNLSVADARHLLLNEGGELTATDVVMQLSGTALVAALTARALLTGNATVWHLALPMVAQYLAVLAALPPVYLAVRHPGLRKDAVGSLRLWLALLIAGAVAITIRGHAAGRPWQEQLAYDSSMIWQWIADAEMQWPMLAAAVSILLELPGRVKGLFEHGPPFMGVGLGCAMRLAVLVLGCAALPWAFGATTRMAWGLWAVIVISDVLALLMHLDIQYKLRKVESAPES